MNNRRHERQPSEIEAVYSVRAVNVHTGMIKDFSQGGVFLQYADQSQYLQLKRAAIHIGDPLEAVVSHQGREFTVRGKIAHWNDIGLGVQFTEHHATVYQLLDAINTDQEAAVQSARKHFIDKQKHMGHPAKEKILASFLVLGREYIEENFNEFFDVLDESLLDEADKQKSDEQQHPYFDAMGLLRKHRKNILGSIADELKIALDQIAAGRDQDEASKKINPEISISQLSLVEKEDFEDWLIVRVVVSRADLQFKEPLLELQLRLDAAFPVANNTSTQNPFSPSSVCRSLDRCIRHLRFDQKIERLIFRVYQNRVIDRLGKLYQQLNTILRDNGVLPDIDVHRYLAAEALKKRKASGETFGTVQRAAQPRANATKPNASQVGLPSRQLDRGAPTGSQQASATAAGGSGISSFGALPLPDVSYVDSAEGASTQISPAIPGGHVVNPGNISTVSLARLQESLSRTRTAYSTASRLMRLHQKLYDDEGAEQTDTEALADVEETVAAQLTVPAPLCAVGGAAPQTISRIQQQVANEQVDYSGQLPLLEFVQQHAPQESALSDSEREAIEMMDQLFVNIVDTPRIAPQLKDVLRRLALPLLKVMLHDPTLFQAEKHPARQLINSLAMLSDKDSVNLANNKKAVERTVANVLNNYDSDLAVFESAQEQLRNEIDREQRVIQRNMDRVMEACRGQEKINLANTQIEAELNQRLAGKRVPLALVNLLEAGWRELMRLCLFREGEDSRAWAITLLVIDQLVLRLSPGVYDETKITFSADELLKLVDKGLSKIPQTRFRQADIIAELERLLRADKVVDSDLVTYHAKEVEKDNPLKEFKKRGEKGSEESFQRWIKRAQDLKEGQWLEFDALSDYSHLYQLAWQGENGDRFVFVNHHGMKVADLDLAEIALKLKKGDVRVLNEQSFSAVDRGLDALVQKIYDRLAFETAHDQLTGLVTRKEFERCLARGVARSKKNSESYLLCFFDLEEFKVINNTCGYEAGDMLLRSIARRMAAACESDDVLGRLGSDQFAVLATVKNEAEAYRKTNMLKEIIELERFEWNNEKFVISCIGSLVVFDHTNNQVLELLRDVESACILAKKAGHKEIQVFDPLDGRMEERDNIMSWVARINRALDNNQLKLRCQKIMPIGADEGTHKPHFEILLTVVDEKGEHLPPVDFIRAAEEYSRMAAVDRWVINYVLEWMTTNRHFLNFIGGFAINLSGHSMNDDTFLDFIFKRLVETGVPRDKVIFEVTETTAVANLKDAADFIREMREIGCRFSLDDFGAGHSSYAYLKHLPVDFIKIDGSFVRNIANDDVDYAMVKSITDMGHFLGKLIIAEFVSDQDILETVADIGVDYVQGFHLGNPVFLDSLIESEVAAAEKDHHDD